MTIIIPNIEIPKDENVFLLLSPDGCVSEKIGDLYHITTGWKELPPHGDCVDRDAYMERMKDKIYRFVVTIADGTAVGYKDIKYSNLFKTLKDEPVLLEANK